MGANKPDEHNAPEIVDPDNEPAGISLDVKDNLVSRQNVTRRKPSFKDLGGMAIGSGNFLVPSTKGVFSIEMVFPKFM